MKLKKLLAASFLASSLLLSSCDGLINQLKPKTKSSEEETSENSSFSYGDNINSDDYQGKEGATQLKREEWEKAFDLEEMAFHRSCKVTMTSAERAKIVLDVDHGNMKIVQSFVEGYQGEYHTYENVLYLVIEKIITKGEVMAYTVIEDGDENWVQSYIDKTSLESIMSEIGILPYEYDNFKYDSSSKTYKADSYRQSLGYEGSYLDISNCEITIVNGLPYKVDFDFAIQVDAGSVELEHYTAVYSDYGAIKVEIPAFENTNNNQGTGLLNPVGEEISFKEFANGFAKRDTNVNYNHVDLAITVDGEDAGQSTQMSADFVYGMWQSDNINHDTVVSFILNEEQLEMIGQEDGVSFFFDSETKTYAYHYATDLFGSTIAVNVYFNSSFYAIYEELALGASYEYIAMSWSNIDQSDSTMNVSNRSFKGIDILEKNYAYYMRDLEITQSMSLDFDSNGHCQLAIGKVSSNNQVVEYDGIMYGEYYQIDNNVIVNFRYSYAEGEYAAIPEESMESMTFVVNEDKLLLETREDDENGQSIEVHIIYAFEQPFGNYIDFPSIDDNNEDQELDGAYYFTSLDYELKDGGTDEEAIAAIQAFARDEQTMATFMSSAITIMEELGQLGFVLETGTKLGEYSVNGDVISATLTSFYTFETGETSQINPEFFTCTIKGNSLYLCISSTEHYNIYAVYTK